MTFILNAQTVGEDILTEAAEKADVFDPELAVTLRAMAADYAGPYIEPGSRLLSPAYAYQKDAG